MKLFKKQQTETHFVYEILGIKFKKTRKLNKGDFSNLKNWISNEVFVANIVSDVHSKVFSKYKNANEGKDIVIVACGPTMKDYVPFENVIHIGVNKAYQNEKIKFDYLFAQDYTAVKDHLDNIVSYPAVKFLGNYITGINGYLKECIIPMKYYNNLDVNMYFSNVPRNFMYPYLEHCGLFDYHSVIFSVAQFALYTNPRRIYLVGCDCSDSGYFDGSKQAGKSSHLVYGWQKLKEYKDTYYPDIEIISINPVGLKGLFEDKYTQKDSIKI